MTERLVESNSCFFFRPTPCLLQSSLSRNVLPPLHVLELSSQTTQYMSHSYRVVFALTTIARQTLPVRSSSILAKYAAPARRAFTTTMAPWKPNSEIPKHEMVYFPQMTTSLPSESAEFRRVLWTGLYSQLVLMTVPVGGDIGDEVSWSCSLFWRLLMRDRNTRSIRS